MSHILTENDFVNLLGEELSPSLTEFIRNSNLEYKKLDAAEVQKLICLILKYFHEQDFVKAGEHRIIEWEKGWGENLDQLESGDDLLKSITPKYFNKYNAVRFDDTFIQPITDQFEKKTLDVLVRYLAEKFAGKSKNIWEFGCGTGHNLLNIRRVNKDAALVGLDWAEASQKIINLIKSKGFEKNISGFNFNYFEPVLDIEMPDDTAVFTIASMEQVGENWCEFLNFLLDKKPSICIHIEPIGELLSDDDVLQLLSKQYFERRNYLKGYLSGLEDLEKSGRIQILEKRRSKIGSLFIEGYSIVVWKPTV